MLMSSVARRHPCARHGKHPRIPSSETRPQNRAVCHRPGGGKAKLQHPPAINRVVYMYHIGIPMQHIIFVNCCCKDTTRPRPVREPTDKRGRPRALDAPRQWPSLPAHTAFASRYAAHLRRVMQHRSAFDLRTLPLSEPRAQHKGRYAQRKYRIKNP